MSCRCSVILGILLGFSHLASAASLEVIDARFRPDRDFPHFARFWTKKTDLPNQREAIDAPADGPESSQMGGSLHIYLQNTSSAPLKIDDVRLSGVSLKSAIIYSKQRIRKKFASIYFSSLDKPAIDRLVHCGEPIWWRIDPPMIPPGTMAEVIVRLRQHPQITSIPVEVIGGGHVVKCAIAPKLGQPRIRSISFSPTLDRMYVFVEPGGQQAPRAILLNGQDVTALSRIAYDAKIPCVPITLALSKPLVNCSFHVVQVKWGDGVVVSAGARAWSGDFVYGMFGGRNGDLAQGRAQIQDYVNHNINVQMPGPGAGGAFTKTEAGRQFCRENGFRSIVQAPGKQGGTEPAAYYVHDEPDAGDAKMEGVPGNKKIGGMAQWCIEHAQELRNEDPNVPQLINIDSTYTPQNWYVYGQLADIFATDPYFQSRQTEAYNKDPSRIPIFQKITYLYAVASIAQSASAPRPMHVMLNAVEHLGENKKQLFRFATPEEKRIELYYAMAAGAKAFSYWWFTPGNKSNGLGAASHDPAAAKLWREIGRLGAEVRTAGPVLLRSCPVDLPVSASTKSLWTRCLLADDTLVLVVVNDHYLTEQKGTTFEPLSDVTCRLKLPGWLGQVTVFDIKCTGISDVKSHVTGGETVLELGKVDLTRLIVLTRDASLRGRLEKLYQSRFAPHELAMEKGQ